MVVATVEVATAVAETAAEEAMDYDRAIRQRSTSYSTPDRTRNRQKTALKLS